MKVFEVGGGGWSAEDRVVGLRTPSGCIAFTSELFESEKNVRDMNRRNGIARAAATVGGGSTTRFFSFLLAVAFLHHAL